MTNFGTDKETAKRSAQILSHALDENCILVEREGNFFCATIGEVVKAKVDLSTITYETITPKDKENNR